MWCVWNDLWGGTFEFVCGLAKADELLSGGMTKINGKPCSLSIVGEGPGWLQIRATISTEGRTAKHNWEMEAVAA